jgi:hypothetical protein
MLPDHEHLVPAMARRTTADAERAARDRGFLRDAREGSRAVVPPASSRQHPQPDCRPCPPPAADPARGLVG